MEPSRKYSTVSTSPVEKRKLQAYRFFRSATGINAFPVYFPLLFNYHDEYTTLCSVTVPFAHNG